MKKCFYYYSSGKAEFSGIVNDYHDLFVHLKKVGIKYKCSYNETGGIIDIQVYGRYSNPAGLFISTIESIEDLYKIDYNYIFTLYCGIKGLSIEDFFAEPGAEVLSQREMCQEIWNDHRGPKQKN